MSDEQPIRTNPGATKHLTAFQQNTLVILAEGPRYGLAIKRELEEYYNDEVNHGRLYPNLNDLVEMGLVEKSELDKRTNQYSLTDDGKEAILNQFGWEFSKFVTGEDRTNELHDLVDTQE